VKEQSHKDEMSKALRGDFERLRDRGVATTLAPRDDPQPEPAAVVVPFEAREPASPEPVTQQTTDAPVAEAEEPRSGWLGRLRGR
jgi:hypothetical protein